MRGDFHVRLRQLLNRAWLFHHDTVKVCADIFDDVENEYSETNNCKTAKGCFIATSALGPDDSSVDTLRAFRDTHLSTNSAGRGFISAYYRLSPPIAEYIDDHPALKPVVRAALLPSVGVSEAALNVTIWQKLLIAGAFLFIGAAFILRTRTILAKG